jgi:hypothetical protein
MMEGEWHGTHGEKEFEPRVHELTQYSTIPLFNIPQL